MRQRGYGPARCLLISAVLVIASSAFAVSPARAASPPETRQRATQIVDAIERGHFSFARKLALDGNDALLRSYVRWRELLDAPEPASFAAYADFLASHPDWPERDTLRARGEDRLDGRVGASATVAYFAGGEPRTPRGTMALADALIVAGRRAQDVSLLRQSWIEDDFGADQERRFLSTYGAALRPEDHRARLDRVLWAGEIAAAQRLLPRVDAGSRKVATARIRLQGLERVAEAAYADVPKSLRGDPGLQYDRVRFFTRRSRDALAIELLLRPPARLGQPALWWREQHRLIRDLLDDGRMKEAYALARVHRQSAGLPFAEAEFLAGWLALRFNKEPAAAKAHFERLWNGVGTPISRSRAAYWAGRASEATGDRAAAASWYERAASYPTAFYGQEAARELGERPAGRLGEVRLPSKAAQQALLARPPARLGEALCGLKDGAVARPFFRHLGATTESGDGLSAVVALAQSCGRADLALAAARAADGVIEPHMAYPLPRVRGFLAESAALPEPSLRLAVARQESLFDTRARSPAGAIGLMQLMPGTAQATARALKLGFSRARLTSDPEYNVRLGSVYLGQQLQRYDGETALALAAYNAGPSRVAHWLETLGDPRGAGRARLIDWIELIPFNETRNYVQRVLEAETVYARLLELARDREAASRGGGEAPRS
jgi:soluble lytic murein transglycosylase